MMTGVSRGSAVFHLGGQPGHIGRPPPDDSHARLWSRLWSARVPRSGSQRASICQRHWPRRGRACRPWRAWGSGQWTTGRRRLRLDCEVSECSCVVSGLKRICAMALIGQGRQTGGINPVISPANGSAGRDGDHAEVVEWYACSARASFVSSCDDRTLSMAWEFGKCCCPHGRARCCFARWMGVIDSAKFAKNHLKLRAKLLDIYWKVKSAYLVCLQIRNSHNFFGNYGNAAWSAIGAMIQ